MKRYILTMLSLIAVLLASAQDTFYYYGGKKIPLKESDEKVLVLSDEGQEFNLGKLSNLTFERKIRFEGMEGRIYSNLPDKSFVDAQNTVKKICKDLKICRGYTLENGETIYGTHKFAVRLFNEKDFSQLTEVASKFGCSVIGIVPYMSPWYYLEAGECLNFDGVQAANLFFETGLFANAEPVFADNEIAASLYDDIQAESKFYNEVDNSTFKHHDGYMVSHDPYSWRQWSHYNIDHPEWDSNVSEAWNYATGKGVVIAIYDSYFDYDHPDLKGKIHPNSKPAPADFKASSGYSDHGTHCAGIAAATKDNDEGIAGVAPDAILLLNSRDGLASSIGHAKSLGADVFSTSLVSKTPYDLLKQAVDSAFSFGRDGKGMLVCAAAANWAQLGGESNMYYPAYYDNCVGVANYTYLGKKSPNSSWGPGVFIAGPGMHIWSLTVGGDVKEDGGTSMATPFVAGVIALMLERNPNLTATQIMKIIAESGIKLDERYPYDTQKEFGSWNKYLGYGAIDAAYCVKNAIPTQSVVNNPINSNAK